MTCKYCQDCGAAIATWPGCDWYRYISIKRCPECAAAAKLIQSAQSKRRLRRIRRTHNARLREEREAKKIALENKKLERQKNALLLQEITALGGRADWAERRRMWNGK